MKNCRKCTIHNKRLNKKVVVTLKPGKGRLKKPGEGLDRYLEEDLKDYIHSNMTKMKHGTGKLVMAMTKGTSVVLKNRLFELCETELNKKYGVYKCDCTLRVSKGHLTIEDIVLYASISFFKNFTDTVPESELIIDKDCDIKTGERLFLIPFSENGTKLTCKVDILNYLEYFKTSKEELVRLSLRDAILYSELGIHSVISGKLHCVNITTGDSLDYALNLCQEGAEVTFAASTATIDILKKIKEARKTRAVLIRLLCVECKVDMVVINLLKYVDCLDNLLTSRRYCNLEFLKHTGEKCSLMDRLKGYRDFCPKVSL